MSRDQIPLNSVDRHVGARLRARRLFVQMSEEWLAGFLGISEDQLCAIEEGRARLSCEDLLHVADLIRVTEAYFFQGFGVKGLAGGDPVVKTSWVRDVDRWFRDHVSPHEGLFLRVARRMTGNLETARDLVQDAYAAVLTGERWRSVENPRAFVRKAITNLALDGLRRQKVVPMVQFADTELSALADVSPDASQSLSDRESLRLVLAAIEKLPGQCRQIFIMRRIDDVPPAEIAERLGIGIGTVKSQLARGMVELHKYLENHRKAVDLKVWVARRASEETLDRTLKDRKR